MVNYNSDKHYLKDESLLLQSDQSNRARTRDPP